VALDFPVRHVHLGTHGRFQVETGPILVLDDEMTGARVQRLRRAYVAFSSIDRAEFLVDSPRGHPPGAQWVGRMRRDCRISLLRGSQ
jgi:hypothetical protein